MKRLKELSGAVIQKHLVHGGRRCARLARRDEGANWVFVPEQQRSQTGCSGG